MSPSSSPRSARPSFSRGSAVARPAVEERRARRRSRRGSRRSPARGRGEVDRLERQASSARGRADERRLEIGDEVVGRLDPDREPDEVPRRRRTGRVGGRGVRHPVRVLDQALDAAERLGEREDLRPGDERDGLLLGLDEERDHAAEVAHLARGDLVAGVVGEAGVEHALDRRVPLEERDDGARVLAVLAHPDGERLQPAQHEPRSRTGRARRRATSAGSGAARRSSGRSSPTKPPTTSEWPPRYFVVEWTTMSAPSSSGCWRYGVANVLSTTSERAGARARRRPRRGCRRC